ncbi:homocysteine S-methyltransferase family protein [Roseibium aggregatum]|uniref:homocysteine S-methyltransferase family protein n=1 Tax=Roseibium aggregatum TaxID=187304 RepID=UPI001AD925D5|nr:homocysteine S-methyltransferase family protein [Roseibium aggregatum]
MSTSQNLLPHLSDKIFLTDGGIETSLIFLEGIDLPYFASFTLLETRDGRAKLLDYYRPYAKIAALNGTGFVLESPTWRSNPDWAEKLGYSAEALDNANRDAIGAMKELALEFQTGVSPFAISGCIGPRGDGYVAGNVMSTGEACDYHARQIEVFCESGADLVTAVTMTNVPEATGVAIAAKAIGIPCVISFTVETDGRLPSGVDLGDAIQAVDAATDGSVAYYMINCAHPAHFAEVLDQGGEWVKRICGIRANASQMSHEELDAAEELDSGDPEDLAIRYAAILDAMPWVRVVGGCCGTDHRHISAICTTCCGHSQAA